MLAFWVRFVCQLLEEVALVPHPNLGYIYHRNHRNFGKIDKNLDLNLIKF